MNRRRSLCLAVVFFFPLKRRRGLSGDLRQLITSTGAMSFDKGLFEYYKRALLYVVVGVYASIITPQSFSFGEEEERKQRTFLSLPLHRRD